MKVYSVVYWELDSYEPFFQDGPSIDSTFPDKEEAIKRAADLTEARPKGCEYGIEVLESELKE